MEKEKNELQNMLSTMQQLIKQLNNASYAYYMENREVMSDLEYDKLYEELESLEKKTGTVMSTSPTQNVGYTVLSSLNKVTHSKQMLSLDKTKDTEKLISFLGENKGLLSLKLDGLTVVLHYNKGKFVRAITRGNGQVGEDVTHNASVFQNIPLTIKFEDELLIRGEAVISFSNFALINENLAAENKYKNPRNLCSGSVRQLNNEITASRFINYFAFELLKEDQNKNKLKSENLKFLKELGFDVVEFKVVDSNNLMEELEYFKNNVKSNGYASDGLVLTYDNIEFSKSLGETSKFPRDSIAFKWEDELAQTKLINIMWNTSRTGLINPIGIFEPVELEGTIVNKASLHNLSIVENLQLGVGDIITVYKANMIIPQIAENLTRSNRLLVPTHCPECKEAAEVISLKDGKALFCSNPNCRAQLVKSVSHFASRDALNIEGLSEATIDKFVNSKFIQNYVDIYYLEKYKDEIINMNGFREKSYNKLIRSIEKSKEVFMPNFIYALGINNVGISNAKLLCKKFDYNLEKIKNADASELLEIDGFGEVIAESIVKYFKNENNIILLNKAVKILKFKGADTNNVRSDLIEKTFVITGNINKFKNRKQLQTILESRGARISSTVTSKTNYLINNDNTSTSSKNVKAKELNIPVISEEELVKIFNL